MELMEAKDLPLPEGYSKQTGGAWRKGYAAYVNGKTKGMCPYGRKIMRNPSFYNVYRTAWLKGWEEAKSEGYHSRKP